MTGEDVYVNNIENGLKALRLKSKTPKDTNIAVNLNKLKTVNEGLYQDYLTKYKKALEAYNEAKQ